MKSFTFAFQPIVDTRTQRVVSYEALVRGLDNESAGTLLASVPDADLHAFDVEARRRAIALAAELCLTADLNLNLLPGSLLSEDPDLARTMDAARECGLPISRIVVEISEHELIHDPGRLRQQLAAFRASGGRVAIDDFGAGHSGLSLLADFAPDIVKLDAHLCRDLDLDPRRQAIVRAILRCCRELRCDVVAEGIERAGEFQWGLEEGVSLFQGYLFGRPAFERLAPVSTMPSVERCESGWFTPTPQHAAL